MHDLPRIGFLIVVDALLVAALFMLLGGCVVTPSRFQHGDFIMNVGSSEQAAVAPSA